MSLFLIQFEIKLGKSFVLKDEMIVPAKDVEEAKSTFNRLVDPLKVPALILPRPKGPRMLVPLENARIGITGCAKVPAA